MIVFVAPNPNMQKNIEGYFIRVKAIDELFSEAKIYLPDIKDTIDRIKLLEKASMIYVHSLYMVDEWFYYLKPFAHKVIIDLHGAVPEEEAFTGNSQRAKLLSNREQEMFSSFEFFVAVTNAMKKHYTKKYSLTQKTRFIILPIFGSSKTHKNYDKKKSNSVVYAGGAQLWQNIDLMTSVAKQMPTHNFTFLTKDVNEFQKLANDAQNITIKSVKPEEVETYYTQATFGFALRSKSIVNSVACPTKLIEYLQNGVIPIVMHSEIGDLKELGYQFVALDQFKNQQLSEQRLREIIQANTVVVSELNAITKEGAHKLRELSASLTKVKKVLPTIDATDYFGVLDLLEAKKADIENIIADRDRIVAHSKNCETQNALLQAELNRIHNNPIKFVGKKVKNNISHKLSSKKLRD